MFGFGDEFTIESYGIPWLIWIQLLVMVLLVLLLCCFSIITLDPSEETATVTAAAVATKEAAASASTSGLICDDIQLIEKSAVKHDSSATVIINHRQNIQGAENPNIKVEIASSTSRRVVDGEENTERQELSSYLQPCHYFNWAKLAFLKCLGLDPTSDTPQTQQHRKRKES